jgi:hypothetical protein
MKRRELDLPLVCALVGALWGICWGMVHRQSDLDRTRVHLEQSVPVAVAGLVAGAVVGAGLRRASGRCPPLTRVWEAVLIPVLAGSIAGPLGWLCRDAALDWSGEEAIRRAAAWGAGAGLGLYAVTLVYRAVRRRTVAAAPGTSFPVDRRGE